MKENKPEKGSFSDMTEKLKGFFIRLFAAIRDFFTRSYIAVKRFFIRGKAESHIPEEALSGGTVVFSGAAQALGGKKKPDIPEEELTGKGREPHTIYKKARGSRPFILQLLVTISKVAILAILTICMIGFGAVLGLANGYLESTPDLDLEQLTENDLTSNIYAADGTLLTTYAGMENRYYATLEEIPDLLEQAVIAIEDVRFYHHSGVDFKRLLSSFIGNLTGSSSAGGSTITQQLIKNQILSNERSYKRKIQEAYLALQLEQEYEKEQILEAYLNIIPLGGTNYGVKAAAKDYFGKELDELTLREMACLAGITQYPSAYSPRYVYYTLKDTTKLDRRIELVLNAMYTAGYISLEERNAALEDEFTVIEVSTTNQMYSYPHFVEYAISDVITQLLEYRGLEYNSTNKAAIENELRTSGYSIYTTLDPNLQTTLQDTIENYDAYPGLRNSEMNTIKQSDGSIIIQPQAAAVIIDQSTGQIKAMVGSRYTPTAKLTNNRAVTNRMPVGSSIKPIAVYGPAFEKGYSGATIMDNILLPIPGWETDEGYPTTSKGTLGPVTLRSAVVGSWNNVAARTLMYLTTIEDAVSSLINLGIDPEHINKDGVGLALGSSGISMLELTAAYSAIANGGEYIEPISFTRVEDPNGNIVLSADMAQERHEAFSPGVAYMLVDILENAVRSGTGRTARIDGMTVAGKTGSVANERGVVFAGFTPYYTSALWIGHDNFERLEKGVSGSKTAAPLWQSYMEKIHRDLADKDILDGDYSDYGLVRETVCSVSGLLPTESCYLDPNHVPVTDYFLRGYAPEVECMVHQPEMICTVSGMICGPHCPLETQQEGSVVVLPEGSEYYQLETEELLGYFPNLRLPADPETGEDMTLSCTIHTPEWAENQILLANAIAEANAAISSAESFISSHESTLPGDHRNRITSAIGDLKTAIGSETPDVETIRTLTSALTQRVEEAKNELDNTPNEDDNNGFDWFG